MNKINKWVTEHSLFLIIILFICLIPLYIIYFNTKIDEKILSIIVNVIVAVAAVVSTFFLYLAFKESKLSNILKITEPKFDLIEKKVIEQEAKAKEFLFTENQIKLINKTTKIPPKDLYQITYSTFMAEFAIIIKAIEANQDYIKCQKDLGSSSNYQFPPNLNPIIKVRIIEIATTQILVYNAIQKINKNYANNIFRIYSEIDYSNLHNEYKVFLTSRMNNVSFEISELYRIVFSENMDNVIRKFQRFDFDRRKNTLIRNNQEIFEYNLSSMLKIIDDIKRRNAEK
jgi:hypothetical protein